MVHAGSSSFTVSDRAPWPAEAGVTVVWLRGAHDASTDDALRRTLERAMAPGCVALVLDLSEVAFMGASTLRVIARARESLRVRSGSLTLRAPSARARRLIEACGLAGLLAPGDAQGATGQALGSWVAVPPGKRADPQLSRSAPGHMPCGTAVTSGAEQYR